MVNVAKLHREESEGKLRKKHPTNRMKEEEMSSAT